MRGSNRKLLKRAWNACLPQRFIPEYIWLYGISPHDYALVTVTVGESSVDRYCCL